MAGGTIWKGAIHFGDTDLPVKLHSAVKEERIRFHLLHRPDGVQLHQQMICAFEKTPVPPEAQVKGFLVEEGKYVVVAAAELEQTLPEAGRTIEVHEFVRTAELHPAFLDHVYCLEAESAVHAGTYAALAETLRELGVAGICTWSMRKRAHYGALQACGPVLRLTTLRYADEVIAAGQLQLEEIPFSERELQIGSDLINRLTAPFEPHKFVNEHQIKLRELIEKKARGEEIVLKSPRLVAPTAPDRLLQALEESLKKAA